ncbi:MAG: hypothetical protein J0H02_03950 [Armatimonadetes bacterium]|nr:hypothetical protein [Armatimonadota bacterium]
MPITTLTFALSLVTLQTSPIEAAIEYSPYNWYRSAEYSQTANPGGYLKVGFTGSQIAVNLDVSPLTAANVPASQYPVIRYSVDDGPPTTQQLTPTTRSIQCAKGLASGSHRFQLEYVAGYVFLDFWTPINVVRVTGFTLDAGASLVKPSRAEMKPSRYALFLGDSITNGDDNIATFAGGITNNVDTQDATLGYPVVVAAGIGAEYGIVAYGGASWDHRAADGHTPGLMTSFSMLDSIHSRLVEGKFSPIPNDIFINMGENSPPSGDDVPKLLGALRAASDMRTHIFLIVPFSGRSRPELVAGFKAYQTASPGDRQTYVLDLGNNPYLPTGRATTYSVDGQHPLASLHAILGAQLIAARAEKISGR